MGKAYVELQVSGHQLESGTWWQPLNDIALAVCEKGILNNAKCANAKHKNTQSVHSN